jgi:uncharacterized membrane protein
MISPKSPLDAGRLRNSIIAVVLGKPITRKAIAMDNTTPAQTPPPVSAGEDKTVAILAYITLIGFIAAIIIHSNKKTRLGAFHLRQTLGFFLTAIAVVFCQFILFFIPILGALAVFALWIAMLVLWVMGLIAAINGQMTPVPVVGPLYQKWSGTAFD